MFMVTSCRMRDDKNNISFVCRVMHSPMHTIAAVQIFQEGAQKPVVTVRLVDSSQLPLPSMVSPPPIYCFMIDINLYHCSQFRII